MGKIDIGTNEFLREPVLPIVLYFGKEAWDGPRNLRDMIDLEGYPQEIREFITDYPMHLIEVRRYGEYENFRTDLREVFGFLQRAEDKDRLREYLEANEEKFENLSTDAYDMISVMGHSKELQEIRDKYHEEKGGRSNMCQAIKDMIEDGRQEGVQEERQRNVVSSVESVMQNLGLALEAACKALSITEEDYNRAKRAVQ